MTLPYYKDQEILAALQPETVVDCIETAFADYEEGLSQMPEKVYLELPQYNGDFRAMPAYSKRYNLAALKWVNSHPNNSGLPAVMATLLVNDPKTGEAKAILEASKLTAYRTGAAGAVAAKYCSPESASKVAFIGAGVQAYFQLLCLDIVRDIKEATICDLNPKAMDLFVDFAKDMHIHVETYISIKDAVQDADIIVMTTPSKKPLLMADWVKDGAHINAIGADAVGKQECDPELLKKTQVIVDDIAQASHSGEINVPISQGQFDSSDIRATIGELVTAKKTIQANKTSLFDSTGLAIQDLALAGEFLENHIETQ